MSCMGQLGVKRRMSGDMGMDAKLARLPRCLLTIQVALHHQDIDHRRRHLESARLGFNVFITKGRRSVFPHLSWSSLFKFSFVLRIYNLPHTRSDWMSRSRVGSTCVSSRHPSSESRPPQNIHSIWERIAWDMIDWHLSALLGITDGTC